MRTGRTMEDIPSGKEKLAGCEELQNPDHTSFAGWLAIDTIIRALGGFKGLVISKLAKKM